MTTRDEGYRPRSTFAQRQISNIAIPNGFFRPVRLVPSTSTTRFDESRPSRVYDVPKSLVPFPSGCPTTRSPRPNENVLFVPVSAA
jgi:hypothetical protein